MNKWQYLNEGSSRIVFTNGKTVKKQCKEDISIAATFWRDFMIFSRDEEIEFRQFYRNLEQYAAEILKFSDEDFESFKKYVYGIFADEKLHTPLCGEIFNNLLSTGLETRESARFFLSHSNGVLQQIKEYDFYLSNEELHDFLMKIYSFKIEKGFPVIFAELGDPVEDLDCEDLFLEQLTEEADEHEARKLYKIKDLHSENFISVKGRIKICDYGFPNIGLR